jgi:hypothetical protein
VHVTVAPEDESTPLLPHGVLAAAPEAISRHAAASDAPTTANGRRTTDRRDANITILSAQGDDGRSIGDHPLIHRHNRRKA